MRWSLASLMAIGMLASFDAAPVIGNPVGNYPFCMVGGEYAGGVGDCSFASYAQCQAASAGRAAYCNANPYYKTNSETPPNAGRVSRRRH